MIRFGPGGTAGLGYSDGLNRISELKLGALEVEFTYGVRMSNEEAKKIGLEVLDDVGTREFIEKLDTEVNKLVQL